MRGTTAKSLRHHGINTFCWTFILIMACGPALPSLASAETTLEELCGPCHVEVFAKGGKFLEGPAFDQEGNLWVVSIESGWVSKIAPDGKWTDVFNTGGQPQGLKFHKDGRLFGVDRKKGVFVYDPKTQKVSDYVLYFQNENFRGPNDLIFDRQGGLYFTDPWGTSLVNPYGAVYYVSPEGKISRLIENMAFPNGIALAPDDKALYVAETMRNAIWAVQLEEPGVLLVRRARILTYLPGGGIGGDGMTVCPCPLPATAPGQTSLIPSGQPQCAEMIIAGQGYTCAHPSGTAGDSRLQAFRPGIPVANSGQQRDDILVLLLLICA